MALQSLLTATCTLQEEMYTTNNLGERIRGFSDPVTAKCRLNAVGRGIRDDLQLGQIIEDNRYVLYVAPETDISTSHKVTLLEREYKIDRVREYRNGRGALHHLECDLQEIV